MLPGSSTKEPIKTAKALGLEVPPSSNVPITAHVAEAWDRSTAPGATVFGWLVEAARG